jgi:hypothetical protein
MKRYSADFEHSRTLSLIKHTSIPRLKEFDMATTNAINRRFTAKLRKSSNPGGWTYVVWPDSVKFFGTRGLVKFTGTIDGHPFRSSFMAMGDGRHMLPVKADVRKAIGKKAGDSVRVHLKSRIGR